MRKFLEEFEKFHRNKEEFNRLIGQIVNWLGKNKLRSIYSPQEVIHEFFLKIKTEERKFKPDIPFDVFIYATCRSIIYNYGKNNRKHEPSFAKAVKTEYYVDEVFNPPESFEEDEEGENFEIEENADVDDNNVKYNDVMDFKGIFQTSNLIDLFNQYFYLENVEIINLLEMKIKNDPRKMKILSYAKNNGYDNKYELLNKIQKETKIPKKIIEDELNQMKMLIKQIWSESEL